MKDRGSLTARALLACILAVALAAPAWSSGSEEVTSKERVTIRMFTTDAGVPVPQGVDISNNWFINILEDYANVDLILEVPEYQDLTTKLRLLLASQNLPDIVRGTSVADMDKAADDGAFVDLQKYYDKSPVMQKWVTPALADMARSPKGLLYGMPQLNLATLGDMVNVTRGDFVAKYGKMPKTVEEWVEFLRWAKKTYPNSYPITTRIGTDNIWWTGETFFYWYGLRVYDFSIRGGHVVQDFTLPEFKEPLAIFQKMYAENVYDKEYMSNQTTQWVNKIYGKDVVLWSYMNYQVAQYAYTFSTNFGKYGGTPGGYFVVAPQLEKFPASVKDVRYTYPYLETPIVGHRIAVSVQSKYPDRAWKVIEGCASDKFVEAANWGREGIHYKVVDGKKVPIIEMIFKRDNTDPNSHNWVAGHSLIVGQQFSDAHIGIQEQQMGKELYDGILATTMWPRDKAKERGTYFMSFVPPIAGVSEKMSEARAFISQATMEAVTGAITIDQFAAKQADFKQKYGFIADAIDKWVQANKAELRRKGVKEIDW
jgi:ABC-type glycerol-3-phosphate transport system substrate-binding protein